MKVVFAVLASLLVLAVLVPALARPLSLCSDDVRGYEREIGANLDVAGSDMSDIQVGIDEVNRIQTALQDLTPGTYAALRALDSQCRLLSRCAFLSFQPSAARACPVEYGDYHASARKLLLVLLHTESLAQAGSNARANADELLDARSDLVALEGSAGATGGRRTILLQRAQLAETEFLDSLRDMLVLIEELDQLTTRMVDGE